jgi:CRISPR/Cas system CMR-associated protein Cmr1 (group 7 of RAMP superfamily)
MVTWDSNGIMLTSPYCNQSEVCMEYDEDKVDKMVLALLHLTTFKEGMGIRAWKGHDWSAMDRLYEKGYISDPKSAAKSVRMTESGAQKAQERFQEHFVRKL